MNRLPLHARLVAGFVAAMLVLLTGAGVFVYWRVEYALNRALDIELRRATQTIAPLVRADGTMSDVDRANATGADWQVLVPGGIVRDRGGAAPPHALVKPSHMPDRGAVSVDRGALLPVGAVRPLRVRVVRASPDGPWLAVAVRRAHRDEALRELLAQLLIAGFGSLLIAGVVGDLLARSALRPVERYRSRAAEIAAGGQGLRLDVPTDRDDEVTRLGHTLNEMLDAQEAALQREQQFVEDASHELRTPLTLVKARIQLARSRTRSVAEHEKTLDELDQDVERLVSLSTQLLEQGDPAARRAGGADLGAVARQVAEARDAARRGVRVRVEGDVTTDADAHTLERIVANLLDNALLHGTTPVELDVRRDGGWAVLTVTDAGTGMSPEMLSQATRRFARAPEARSRPGSGLGLALVEQLVTAAGGQVRLCSDGQHTIHGAPVDLPCDHDDRMRVTVLLPAT
ncbi:sensor histidine kinase [Nocardioides cavernaquae]|nr:ATP-binding protein [Nocardioides cavernaquae]